MALGTSIFRAGAVLRDGNGKHIFQDAAYGELPTRDVAGRVIAEHQPVYLDVSGVDPALLADCTPIVSRIVKQFPGTPLNVEPAAHFTLGGIRIDNKTRTSMPNLLACGECCGGVHGANRLGGAAMTEALVFGKIAGETAAEQVNNVPLNIRVLRELAHNASPLMAPDDRVRTTATRLLGPIRSADVLQSFLHDIEAEEKVGSFGLLIMMCAAARIRQESRGAHFLKEHPSQDPLMERSLILQHQVLKFMDITEIDK